MENIIYLIGEINDQVVDYFIKNYNNANKLYPTTIYINSNGGDLYHSNVIIDIINKSSILDLTLIAIGQIFSAAFDIFFFTKCKKIVLPDTIGMAHFCWDTFQLNEAGKVSGEYDKFIVRQMKANKNTTLSKLQSIGLNSSELSRIKKGKDCYFTNERLNELLNYGKS